MLVSPNAARQDSGDAAESFVPPIRNGIQLQQRRRRTPVAVRSEGDVAEVGGLMRSKQPPDMALVGGLGLCRQSLQCCNELAYTRLCKQRHGR